MLDLDQEIAEFARRRSLPDDAARELHDLLARHQRPADRYEDLGLIGVGGMGEVRRVRDRDLNRTLAMKVIRADLLGKPSVVARFREEAQVGAQLQHPGVAPVHEYGAHADGRFYFTMKEIKGRPFSEQIRESHANSGGASEVQLHRLCDAFAKVCDAVAYAHSRGVVHRDLKPDNVMIGGFGEVLVIDWGLAKTVGRTPEVSQDYEADEEELILSARGTDANKTRIGQIVGTAAYMAPEQARGAVADTRTDVYALGAILYEVLAGRPPYEGRDARAVLRQVIAGPPEPPGRTVGASASATFTLSVEEEPEEVVRPLPPELLALCDRAMAREAGDRPAEASALAREVRHWLDGAKKRDAAQAVVATADAQGPAADALRERARELRMTAAHLLADVKPWEPEGRKAPGWAHEDEADGLDRGAALAELKREALLRGALTHAPDLDTAHAGLCEIELARHVAASNVRDLQGADSAESSLREHTAALPAGHPLAAHVAAYLKGDGALTLITDPPDAEVSLHRYEVRNRRLVAVPWRALGRTPLRGLPLPMGSYLCVIRHPQREDVRYPVHVGRGEHWDGIAPGERESRAIHLPAPGELGVNDVCVPAGWFWSGGDPDATDSLPRQRRWCEGFVLKRFPVTNHEYLEFLNDLVAQGRDEEALQWVPRARAGSGGAEGAMEYRRDSDGRFALQPSDADGDVWQPDWPVPDVSFSCAVAYGRWLAARTNTSWRLPSEFEREKAARGVDGRFYPWGDFLDPSWCCMRYSHPGRPTTTSVDRFPVDVSVYGARGMGGNVRDWCAEPFSTDGSATAGDLDASVRRVARGGSWYGFARASRCAIRHGYEPSTRSPYLGLRPVRSYPALASVAGNGGFGVEDMGRPPRRQEHRAE